MSVDSLSPLFVADRLSVSIDQKTIVSHYSLQVLPGQVHAIMGPNGSGKSTFALAVAGHPGCVVNEGTLYFNGQDITQWSPARRAQQGIFLVFQYPYAIPGVSVFSFLKEAYQAVVGQHMSVKDFSVLVQQKMALLSIDPVILDRCVNDGFSGGEKKRFELLQALLLKPKLMIIDEIDSGLDSDSLQIVAQGLLILRKENPQMGIIIITHYPKILHHLVPDVVHIMYKGSLVHCGGPELAHVVEHSGYTSFIFGAP